MGINKDENLCHNKFEEKMVVRRKRKKKQNQEDLFDDIFFALFRFFHPKRKKNIFPFSFPPKDTINPIN